MNKQPKKSPHSVETNGRKSLRILCAEDDEQIADMLKSAFKSCGHFFERVSDGQHAFERITSALDFFDLLLTDHQMPRLSGLELVEKLRGAGFCGKIIVHSSELQKADAAAYGRLSVSRILTKPMHLPELLRIVGQLEAAQP